MKGWPLLLAHWEDFLSSENKIFLGINIRFEQTYCVNMWLISIKKCAYYYIQGKLYIAGLLHMNNITPIILHMHFDTCGTDVRYTPV